jgi:hypothetical protein
MLLFALPLAAAADQTWWLDDDGDGFGTPYAYTVAPEGSPPAGYVGNELDCDDGTASINPDASEACDGVDEDCDGDVDSQAACGFPMSQRAGHGYLFVTAMANWEDARATCYALGDYHLVTLATDAEDLWVDTEADAISTAKWWLGWNDIDTEGDWEWEDSSTHLYTNWYAGEPNDGLGGGTEDCALFNRFHPAQGWNDEPCTDVIRYICESGHTQEIFPDLDGDGFGDPGGVSRYSSDEIEGYAADASDCDDTDANVYPGADETWYDGADADCDGHDDDDADFDGSPAGEDCNDADSTVHPDAVEVDGDGVDQDCDGVDGGADTGGGDSGGGDTDTAPPEDTAADAGLPDDGDSGEADTADPRKAPDCGCGTSGGAGAAGLVAGLVLLARRRPSQPSAATIRSVSAQRRADSAMSLPAAEDTATLQSDT